MCCHKYLLNVKINGPKYEEWWIHRNVCCHRKQFSSPIHFASNRMQTWTVILLSIKTVSTHKRIFSTDFSMNDFFLAGKFRPWFQERANAFWNVDLKLIYSVCETFNFISMDTARQHDQTSLGCSSSHQQQKSICNTFTITAYGCHRTLKQMKTGQKSIYHNLWFENVNIATYLQYIFFHSIHSYNRKKKSFLTIFSLLPFVNCNFKAMQIVEANDRFHDYLGQISEAHKLATNVSIQSSKFRVFRFIFDSFSVFYMCVLLVCSWLMDKVTIYT